MVRKLATIMRNRLCIQPVALSWRMAASTIGKPVSPRCRACRAASSARQRPYLSSSKWPPFTELRIVDHQMAVKLAPDQLVKPVAPAPPSSAAGCSVRRRCRHWRGTARRWPCRATVDWSLPRPGSRAALVIRRRLLTKRAQTRQRRFFIRGKQQPVERRLRVVKLSGSGGARQAGARRGFGAATHAGSPSRRRRINAFLNGVKTLYISPPPVSTLPGGNRTLSSKPRQITSRKVFSTAASRWRSLNSY